MLAPLCSSLSLNHPCSGIRPIVEQLAGIRSTSSSRAYSPPPRVPSRLRPQPAFLHKLAQPQLFSLSPSFWPCSPPLQPVRGRHAGKSSTSPVISPPGASLSLTPTPPLLDAPQTDTQFPYPTPSSPMAGAPPRAPGIIAKL
jgi:hypothetical protein